jgi:hypothetical protein
MQTFVCSDRRGDSAIVNFMTGGISMFRNSFWIVRLLRGVLLVGTITGAALAFGSASALCAERPPAVAGKPDLLRTYRFTATIKGNSGVTPFKVGSKITGKFTYDLAAKDLRRDSQTSGHYKAPGNSIEIRCGSLRFVSIRDVRAHMNLTKPFYEGFSIRASEWTLPKGWRYAPRPAPPTFDSCNIAISLQNRRNEIHVLSSGRLLPETDLTKRFRHRAVRMTFYHGIHFPGGSVKKLAVVYAEIDEIEPIRPAIE